MAIRSGLITLGALACLVSFSACSDDDDSPMAPAADFATASQVDGALTTLRDATQVMQDTYRLWQETDGLAGALWHYNVQYHVWTMEVSSYHSSWSSTLGEIRTAMTDTIEVILLAGETSVQAWSEADHFRLTAWGRRWKFAVDPGQTAPDAYSYAYHGTLHAYLQPAATIDCEGEVGLTGEAWFDSPGPAAYRLGFVGDGDYATSSQLDFSCPDATCALNLTVLSDAGAEIDVYAGTLTTTFGVDDYVYGGFIESRDSDWRVGFSTHGGCAALGH